jgi:hypothetical protein
MRTAIGSSFWRDNMWINVILSIDERLDDVQKCVESLRAIFGRNVPIALATYGGAAIGPQPAIKAYATAQRFQYIDIPRHDFLTEEDTKEWHSSETLARIQITQHFADMGYDEIYIMHSDVQARGDFRAEFQKKATGAWSFIAIMVRAGEPFEELCKKGSWRLYFEDNRARLADILTRYNPAFVAQMYAKWGTTRGIWNNFLSKFTLWGDLAQFDLAREHLGFTGRHFEDKWGQGKMCHETIIHSPREMMPICLSEDTRRGTDKAGIRANYERRVCKI